MGKGRILKVGTSNELKKLIKKQIIKVKIHNPHKPIEHFFNNLDVDIISIDKNTVVFELPYKEHLLANILKKIFDGGFKVSDITVNKPQLEEVFIKIAKGEL